jgi:hypothetical protein
VNKKKWEEEEALEVRRKEAWNLIEMVLSHPAEIGDTLLAIHQKHPKNNRICQKRTSFCR